MSVPFDLHLFTDPLFVCSLRLSSERLALYRHPNAEPQKNVK